MITDFDGKPFTFVESLDRSRRSVFVMLSFHDRTYFGLQGDTDDQSIAKEVLEHGGVGLATICEIKNNAVFTVSTATFGVSAARITPELQQLKLKLRSPWKWWDARDRMSIPIPCSLSNVVPDFERYGRWQPTRAYL